MTAVARLAALALVTVALLAVGTTAAIAAGGPQAAASASGTRSTPTLTGSYPLGTSRLSGRGGSATGGRAATARRHPAAGAPGRRPARAGHAGAHHSDLLGIGWRVAAALGLGLLALALRRGRAGRPSRRPIRARRRPPAARPPEWVSVAARARRKRRPVSAFALGVLTPVMHYSAIREAYVLRLIGGRIGPVLVKRPGSDATPGGTRADPVPGPGWAGRERAGPTSDRERSGPAPRSEPSPARREA